MLLLLFIPVVDEAARACWHRHIVANRTVDPLVPRRPVSLLRVKLTLYTASVAFISNTVHMCLGTSYEHV